MKTYFGWLLTIVGLICLIIIPTSFSADVTAKFEWRQPNYDTVQYWKLYWGTAAGGPYEVGEQQFDKTDLQEDQSNNFTIPYPDESVTTYYFVLVAFVDDTHYSGNSNEVLLEMDFITLPGAPLELRVTIVPE